MMLMMVLKNSLDLGFVQARAAENTMFLKPAQDVPSASKARVLHTLMDVDGKHGNGSKTACGQMRVFAKAECK